MAIQFYFIFFSQIKLRKFHSLGNKTRSLLARHYKSNSRIENISKKPMLYFMTYRE